ncbi:MAG: hypothetical protein JRH08_00300 [Deltaproteobacteria bacterium]|nr:hypothetical protein [Deltaproteobacteria bacterium]MBW1929486.1 hypothetical protein [Deltaproteobacteria bacterium]MBW2124144.1 hypothetical protein [Deltaproteobacteria bacterium]
MVDPKILIPQWKASLSKDSAFKACLWAVVLLVFSGCGYRLNLSGSSMRGGLNTLAIPMVESSATVAGLEADFTNIIRQEFLSHSTIPIVSEKEADAVLIGRIERIETAPLSYDIQQTSVQDHTVTYEVTNLRRLKVFLSIRLINRLTGEVLWRDSHMEEKGSYAVCTDPIENRFRERTALKEIARLLAKRVYLKTVDTF